MRRLVVPVIGLLLAGLAACSGDPAKDAAQAQSYLVAFQPIASEVACTAQAGANIAGDAAAQAHDLQGAAAASIASRSVGIFCNGLAKGAPLPEPVKVSAPAP